MKTPKKRILFFIESLHCGGAEKSIVSLLQLLDFTKVDVSLMLLSPVCDDDVFAQYVPKCVNVFSLPKNKGVGLWREKALNYIYAIYWRLLSLVGRTRHKAELLWQTKQLAFPCLKREYDVAIAYQQGFPTYYVAKKVNAKKKLAWVNIDLEKAGYRDSFNRRYYNHYDNIVAVSGQLFENLLPSGYFNGNLMVTLYDILNVDLIHRMSLENVDYPNSTGKVLKIVTVGRLSVQKNYPLAVRTAALLKSRGLKFLWTFVGDGPERQSIEQLCDKLEINDVVALAGLQPNPYPFMRMADIYVHTASFEGFGLTISEAKILGKPVVSTNFRVVYDQITDGVNGLIAEMTPESVADKIINLVSDDELRHNIVDNIHKETNTTSETEIRKFYQLIGLD